jgi:hypothetical protein
VTVAIALNMPLSRWSCRVCLQMLNGGDAKVPVEPWKMAMAGFTAGATSVILTMPFDVVKTRMQVMRGRLCFPYTDFPWYPP